MVFLIGSLYVKVSHLTLLESSRMLLRHPTACVSASVVHRIRKSFIYLNIAAILVYFLCYLEWLVYTH